MAMLFPSSGLEQPVLSGQYLVRAFGKGEEKTTAVREVCIDLYPGQISLLM